MKKLGFIFAFSTLFVLGVSAQTATKAETKKTTIVGTTGNATPAPSSSTHSGTTTTTSADKNKPKKSGLVRKKTGATSKPVPASTIPAQKAPTTATPK